MPSAQCDVIVADSFAIEKISCFDQPLFGGGQTPPQSIEKQQPPMALPHLRLVREVASAEPVAPRVASNEAVAAIRRAASGLEAFRALELILSAAPRLAARETILVLERWLEEGRFRTVDEFLEYLPSLNLGLNVAKSYALDAIIGALVATRGSRSRLAGRGALTLKILQRIRFRLGYRAARRAISRLS